MEEEKKNEEIKTKQPLKACLASYTPFIPKEICSFLDENSYKNSKECKIVREYCLEIIEISDTPQISIKKDTDANENYSEILCRIYEINSEVFEKFLLNHNISQEILENLKDQTKHKEFSCQFEEENRKISLFCIDTYGEKPLITFSFSENSSSPFNIFDEKLEKSVILSFFREFINYFKEIFDRNSLSFYLRKLLSPSEKNIKVVDFIENLSNEFFPDSQKIENNQETLLFDLKIKEFSGANLLEIPKFNQNSKVFENGEKNKIKIN